jgi:hypothetical protein
MAPFARDLGYVDAAGKVLPPFVWNDDERRARMAALDALFFHLYGSECTADAEYILGTLPHRARAGREAPLAATARGTISLRLLERCCP